MTTSSKVLATTDEQFQQDVLDSPLPVLVDFWAEWCGPCRSLAPIFTATAEQFADEVRFVKINIDDNPNIPTQYGVKSIPTLLLFKEQQLVATKVGSASQKDLSDFIRNHL